MRIGIDIDGVLTDLDKFQFDYFSKFCVENNINYAISKSDYEISKSFGLSAEQENAFWNEYFYYYAKHEKARTFASEVIKRLKEDGNEIYIITARWLSNRDDEVGQEMREIVKNWLTQNDIYYDKLVFSKAEQERKIDEIKEFNIDIMIEDSPTNIKDLSSVIPVICYDASYNRDCVGKNMLRCFSWYDIYKNINEISKNNVQF